MSNVAPGYAPPGGSMISVTVVGGSRHDDAALESAVREQARGWFGSQVGDWRCLRIDRVARALPVIRDPNPVDDRGRYALAPGLWRCGDALENASLNGAMVSGRRCAESVLAAVREPVPA